MNILVCIKQVPDTEKVKFHPEKRTLIRDSVENIMNPYDREALETALCLKDKEGAEVTVLSMGLPQAAEVLREAIAMGADKGVLLTDRSLAGSDTLATSTALAAAVKHLGTFDVIFCGKQAVDGDTAQVGPEIAEHLGIPQITGSYKVDYENGEFIVVRENESATITLACPAPVLITVEKSEKEPRFASIKGKMKARKADIPTLSAADLKLDPASIGLNGSPTKVKSAFSPAPPDIQCEIIQEEDPDEAVEKLFAKLLQAEVITR